MIYIGIIIGITVIVKDHKNYIRKKKLEKINGIQKNNM